ncbi:MAG: DNA recombination protein RmuC [Opitutaceae bacterium]|jgi:DNA recombination protein RmuC|nr:DNA recombination protein RmuC [Opitutaceae bacterium]
MDFTTFALILTSLLAVSLGILSARWRAASLVAQVRADQIEQERKRIAEVAATITAQLESTQQKLARSEQEQAASKAQSTAELKAERDRVIEHESRAKQYLADIEKLRATMTTEFQAVAAKLFDEKSKTFTAHNKEQVEGLLTPLRRQISDFRERVDHVHKDDSTDRASLKTQIEQLRQLNTRITDEAQQLTRALKGQAQARGAWGELVLERLLQSSGLRAGEDYVTQESFINESGSRVRPDVIVRLPDQRHLVIDSKVSLIDYELAVNAAEAAARTTALKAHAAAVRRHVEELSGKQYEDLGELNTPDYVLMFVPLEPAFAAALETDPALYEWAFDRRVILVTSPTLLVTLKTVASLWKQDRQTKNAVEIAKRGGLLYDKFVGLYQDLETVGKHLDQTQKSYGNALGKLRDGRGNLLSQVDELRDLGVKTKKILPLPEEEN